MTSSRHLMTKTVSTTSLKKRREKRQLFRQAILTTLLNAISYKAVAYHVLLFIRLSIGSTNAFRVFAYPSNGTKVESTATSRRTI